MREKRKVQRLLSLFPPAESKAIKLLCKIFTQNPGDAESALQLAELYASPQDPSLRDYSKSQAVLEKSLANASDGCPERYFLLAQIFSEQNDSEKSLRLYQAGLSVCQKDPNLYRQTAARAYAALAELYMTCDKVVAAAEAVAEGFKASPNCFDLISVAACVYHHQGKEDLTKKYCEQGIDILKKSTAFNKPILIDDGEDDTYQEPTARVSFSTTLINAGFPEAARDIIWDVLMENSSYFDAWHVYTTASILCNDGDATNEAILRMEELVNEAINAKFPPDTITEWRQSVEKLRSMGKDLMTKDNQMED